MAGFLMVDGIRGDATADGHEGEIEFQSLTYGISDSESPTARRFSNAFIDVIGVLKSLDSASIPLIEAASSGNSLGTIRAALATAWGDEQVVYLTIELDDARIASIVATWDGGLPAEKVALSFEAIRWTYERPTTRGGNRAAFAVSREPTEEAAGPPASNRR